MMYEADPAVTQEEKMLAMLSHLLAIFTGFLAPLIIYLLRRDSPFIAFHALQSTLFQVAWSVALFVSGLLMYLVVGCLIFPLVLIGGWIYMIYMAFQAFGGRWTEYWLVGRWARQAAGR